LPTKRLKRVLSSPSVAALEVIPLGGRSRSDWSLFP
jgi:hypothetical protein